MGQSVAKGKASPSPRVTTTGSVVPTVLMAALGQMTSPVCTFPLISRVNTCTTTNLNTSHKAVVRNYENTVKPLLQTTIRNKE